MTHGSNRLHMVWRRCMAALLLLAGVGPVGSMVSLSAVAYESYDDLDAFDVDLLMEEAIRAPKPYVCGWRICCSAWIIHRFTDWDFNVVTDAMVYGRFAADDVMHMDMGAGVAFRYATLEKMVFDRCRECRSQYR